MDRFDHMHLVGFERYLAAEWAVDRVKFHDEPLGLEALRASEPVRPGNALKMLKASQRQLVEMLVSGQLLRPRALGNGRVAWRFDEVVTARDLEQKEVAGK
jgi:hypothetical protein